MLNEIFGRVFDDGFQRLLARGSAPSPPDGVALELLVVDEPGKIGDAREHEAIALAARLAELRDQGHEQSGMVVLLRASTDAELYEAALRQAGFDTHRAIGGGYYGRQQVSDLCAYLRLLRSRYDDRALLTVLASPLIGVSNAGLYALRRAAQTALFRGLEYGLPDGLSDDDARLMKAFRQRFDRLVEAAQGIGITDLLERIVSEHDYDLACLAQSDGRRRYANVRKLVRLARDYEALRGPDLAGFLALVDTLAELAAQEPEAVLAEEEVDAVRIMTVHAAKGLEFDIVAFADAGRDPNLQVPDLLAPADGRLAFRIPSPAGTLVAPPLWGLLREDEVTAELAEGRRLVYVAMTRARERLIVSGGINARTSDEAPIRWLAEALGLDLASMPAGQVLQPVGTNSVIRVQIHRPDGVDSGEETGEPAVVSVHQLALPLDDVVGARSTRAARPPPARAASRRRLVTCREASRSLRSPCTSAARTGTSPSASSDSHRCRAPQPATARSERSTSVARSTRCSRGGATSISTRCSGSRCEPRIAHGSRRSARPSSGRRSRPRSLPPVTALHEQPFAFAVDGVVFRGVLDVLVRRADGSMLVIDYKTTRLGDRSPDELVAEEYELQRQAYALALLRSGASSVDVAFAFLERADAVSRAVVRPRGRADPDRGRAGRDRAVARVGLRASSLTPRVRGLRRPRPYLRRAATRMSAFDDAERRRMSIVLRRLRKAYPEAGIALHFGSAWELLVATILSAQCTDERVNQVTPGLFARYPDVEAFADASQEELAQA